jgi:hypothetical protein
VRGTGLHRHCERGRREIDVGPGLDPAFLDQVVQTFSGHEHDISGYAPPQLRTDGGRPVTLEAPDSVVTVIPVARSNEGSAAS